MLFKSKKSKDEAKPDGGAGVMPPTKVEATDAKPGAEQNAEAKRRAAQSKHLHAAFGEIVGLLMRTTQFKNEPLSRLEEIVVPAIVTGQFTIAEAQSKANGFVTPVAAVIWASVSEEIDRQLSENNGEPVKLASKDWKSGDNPWLILAAGDNRLIKAMLQRVQETVLKGRPLKIRSPKKSDEAGAPGSSSN